MSLPQQNPAMSQSCSAVREEFSAYLDGDMSGMAMQSMAAHLEGCENCTAEFTAWREIQISLASLGPAKAPGQLQAQLRATLTEERERGTHLAWHRRLAAEWHQTLAPIALRAATGTAATLLLLGTLSSLVVLTGAPSAVQANDERLGAMTQPHYLYSEVPPQPIEFGREVPVLIDAKIDAQGRVYDYTILSGPGDSGPGGSGPIDARVERRIQANLLASVFQPATVFGQPVNGRVMMTYTGVSVRG
ncbi:MAG: zf-HC2 domain-containing protein [Acidobacteriaceae bacterium]